MVKELIEVGSLSLMFTIYYFHLSLHKFTKCYENYVLTYWHSVWMYKLKVYTAMDNEI